MTSGPSFKKGASNNLQISSDAVAGIASQTSYTKEKEIVYIFRALIRTAMTIYHHGGHNGGGYAQIRINGNAVGIERTTTEAEVTYTQDFAVAEGDRIQVYLKTAGTTGYYANVKNFRLSYDLVDNDSRAVVTLD